MNIFGKISLGLQPTSTGLNTTSLGVDPYSNASSFFSHYSIETFLYFISILDSLYSSLAGGYSNYQQSSGLAGASQLSSSLTGSVREMIVCSVA